VILLSCSFLPAFRILFYSHTTEYSRESDWSVSRLFFDDLLFAGLPISPIISPILPRLGRTDTCRVYVPLAEIRTLSRLTFPGVINSF